MSLETLVDLASRVRANAHAPYSHFKVGAALETPEGNMFTGCNIENATYGLTVCAERVAIWKAVSEGATRFSRIAVVVDTEELAPPCGACRQIIWEFCGDIEVVLANMNGKCAVYRAAGLLPLPFVRKFLNKP
jgi:cytidine deaminase